MDTFFEWSALPVFVFVNNWCILPVHVMFMSPTVISQIVVSVRDWTIFSCCFYLMLYLSLTILYQNFQDFSIIFAGQSSCCQLLLSSSTNLKQATLPPKISALQRTGNYLEIKSLSTCTEQWQNGFLISGYLLYCYKIWPCCHDRFCTAIRLPTIPLVSHKANKPDAPN